MNKYEAEYKKSKQAAPPLVRCAACGRLFSKNSMEPHHPHGRRGKMLLKYVWVEPPCHRYIHDNPQWAKDNGLLYPQIYEE
jgi:hypothetical protein